MTAGAGIIFGAFPIFTTLFVRFGGDVDTFNLYGFLLTVVFLAAYMALTKRSFAVPKKAVFAIILAGVMNVVTRILLTYSYEYLDVGIATTLHFMYPLFAALSPNKYLEDRISGAILSEEEIADTASPALADIRRHMRIQSAKIKESLQKIISSPAYAKILREPIITIRQGRYVVPVKSECKNDLPGLVHDVSASGGTYFVEPMSAVNANNALRELELKEKKEIENSIEIKLEPIYEELEEIRKHIRDAKNIEQSHMNLIIASYRFRLVQLCKGFLSQGYITAAQMEQLSEFYKLYTGLGGNGQAEVYYSKAMQLPLKVDDDETEA